jgi:hypothetical protein
MPYLAVMKDRAIANFKSFGTSARTMLAARKKLPKTKSAIYLFLMMLPIISVIFVTNQILALTCLICLFIYLPIIEAYAYSVIYGGN